MTEKKTRRTFTPEERQTIVSDAVVYGVREAASRHGLKNFRQIYNWKYGGALDYRQPLPFPVKPIKRLFAVESNDEGSNRLAPYEPSQNSEPSVVLNSAESVDLELKSIDEKIRFLEDELSVYKTSILPKIHDGIEDDMRHRHLEMLDKSVTTFLRLLEQIRSLERDRTMLITEHTVIKDVTEKRITHNAYLGRLAEMVLQACHRQVIEQVQDVEVVAS